jgi:cell division protein FtsI/penicillin-binding protein 2
MCSYPTFNPNAFGRSNPADRTNRAITLPYEPGSAAKPIFAAAAVDAGVVTFDTNIYCENGTYFASKGGRISDHGHQYGYLSVLDIVVHSSNIGMAKIGEKLGNRQLRDIAYRFGFGQKTGVELTGEDQGIVRDMHKWDGYSLRRVPFGQEIAVTAMQLVMAFGALSNGGELLAPRLVDRVTDNQGQVVWQGQRKVVRRVLKPSVSAQTLESMAGVVERGTGSACKMKQWTSFGKTGTAQIPGPQGYQEGAYTGTFIGGAPVNKPRVLCLISVYWPNRRKGYYGGTVAAPYVKNVLEQSLAYLNVPPDRQPEVALGD